MESWGAEGVEKLGKPRQRRVQPHGCQPVAVDSSRPDYAPRFWKDVTPGIRKDSFAAGQRLLNGTRGADVIACEFWDRQAKNVVLQKDSEISPEGIT